ncbi:hypothetical protein SPJ1_1531 [Streptococcus parauberis KRS-02083]|uniref:Uncharacterized protein n=1 Tax=Streptococcus parauberis KRS-02083 TaxID=1207545 RepID=A0ABN0IQD8_9STRE|nr:hypothetical protein SPJ1_1531 [Streptococcus parauberis KRS-02083]
MAFFLYSRTWLGISGKNIYKVKSAISCQNCGIKLRYFSDFTQFSLENKLPSVKA